MWTRRVRAGRANGCDCGHSCKKQVICNTSVVGEYSGGQAGLVCFWRLHVCLWAGLTVNTHVSQYELAVGDVSWNVTVQCTTLLQPGLDITPSSATL